MTPSAEHEDLDPITLARFLSGESDAGEAARVRRWIEADAENSEVAAQLRAAWTPGASQGNGWNVSGAWERMAPHVATSSASAPRISGAHRRPIVLPMHALATHRRRRVIAAAAAASIIAAFVWRGLPQMTSASAVIAPQMRAIATGNGERAHVTLGDGSRVVLAPGSRLRYDANFGDTRRDVYLDGEAYFQVRHDTARPFLVHTHDAITEDIGTAFSVRQYAKESGTRVVVGEGRVSLRTARSAAAAQAAELGAGELGRVTPGMPVPVVQKVNAERYLAWTNGWLAFQNASLPEVMAELARWYDLDVTLTDSSLADRHLVASFKAATADDALHIVATSLGVRIERRGRQVFIMAKAASPISRKGGT